MSNATRLEQSRSQRILWLLEELKLFYELQIFHRNPKSHFAPPELKKIHALGKSPVISVKHPDSSEPVIVAESAFIVEYLLDHFGQESTLLPKRYKEGQEGKVGGETEQWMRFKYFLHYAEGSLMPYMTVALVALRMSLPILSASSQDTNCRPEIKNAPLPFFLKPITATVSSKIFNTFLIPNFKTHFDFLEESLNSSPEEGKYLCGPHLTGADILLSFPLIAGKERSGLSAETYPKLYAYVNGLEEESGYKAAVRKISEIDGKFEVMFEI
jgi:glutathione S-transferase